MLKPTDIPYNPIAPGDVIRADLLCKIANAAGMPNVAPGSFINGAMRLQAPAPPRSEAGAMAPSPGQGAFAMIIADVGACGDFSSGSGTIPVGQVTDGAIALKLVEEDNVFTIEVETEPDPEDPETLLPVYLTPINMSRSMIRADGKPIILGGTRIGKAFVVHNWDMASLKGHAKGSAVVGELGGVEDDPDMQIPFHPGGSDEYELDSEKCNLVIGPILGEDES